jgi:hypothetical protein
MRGRYSRFCASLPWRRRVPMMYIWAWAGPALPPLAFTSSRMTEVSVRERPSPPYSHGMSAPM